MYLPFAITFTTFTALKLTESCFRENRTHHLPSGQCVSSWYTI